nr:PTS sugar transporter subunit IIA [Lacticaseibacillus thailandensis]
MGYNTEENADTMFFLGITDSSQQVGLLQEFTDLLQDEDFVNTFKKTTSPEDMYKLVAARI